MSGRRSGGIVDDVLKRGSVGIAMLVVLALAGCVRVAAPREDPAKWARRAVAPVDGGPNGPIEVQRRLEVIWRDPAFPDPDLPDVNAGLLKPPMTANVVYRVVVPAVDLPKLVAAHDNVLAITVRQPYFAVPWPSP